MIRAAPRAPSDARTQPDWRRCFSWARLSCAELSLCLAATLERAAKDHLIIWHSLQRAPSLEPKSGAANCSSFHSFFPFAQTARSPGARKLSASLRRLPSAGGRPASQSSCLHARKQPSRRPNWRRKSGPAEREHSSFIAAWWKNAASFLFARAAHFACAKQWKLISY